MSAVAGLALAVALAIMAFAAAFHLYWALGGGIGLSVSLPQHQDGQAVLSSLIGWWRFGAFAVALFLVAVAFALLAEAGAVPIEAFDALRRWGLVTFGTACIARVLFPSRYVGFFKRITGTRWAHYDTRYYSPLFLALGIAILVVIFCNGFTVF